LVLLPGGAYQIKWSGGPPVRVEVSFSVDNASVCQVDAAGRVVAREVGSTTLVASAQATDEQGNRHDYGSTIVDVVVRPLSGTTVTALVEMFLLFFHPLSPLDNVQAFASTATQTA
jgi:hypothetical protein